MKTITRVFVWLLVPIAFLFVCYDVAKEFVEQKLTAKLEEKNT
jgi:hypothetical protein